MKDTIAKRRSVLNSVIRQIAEQLPIADWDNEGEPFPISVAFPAWKESVRRLFFPGQSSEDVIRRDNWNETVLAIEAWASHRGVTFENREDKE